MINKVLDTVPFEMTTPGEAQDLLTESALNGSVGNKDTLNDKTIFNAIVLGGKVNNRKFTPDELTSMFGININQNKNLEYYGYRVRITDFDSPHSFYPIPCPKQQFSHTNNVIRGMHTLVLTTKADLTEKTTVQVHLRKRNGKYDLSYGFLQDVTGFNDKFYEEIYKENPYLKKECSPTGKLFKSKIRTLDGGDIGKGFKVKQLDTIKSGRYKGYPIFGEPRRENPFGLNTKGPPKADYEYIVVHITVGSSPKGAVKTLGEQGFAYHYLVDYDGSFVKAVDPNFAAIPHGGTNDSNAKAIGISLVNSFNEGIPGKQYKNYTVPDKTEWYKSNRSESEGLLLEPFPAKQVDGLIKLIKTLKNSKGKKSRTSNIKFITGHENIKGSKQDPGPAFDPFWDKVVKETGLAAHPEFGIKG